MSVATLAASRPRSTVLDSPQVPEDPPSYEAALEQLEELINRIESGDAGLEESIRDYEHGAKLIRRCREILDAAETRITELKADDGEHTPPTDTDDDT